MLSKNLSFTSLSILLTLENYSFQEPTDSNIDKRTLTDTNPKSASLIIRSLTNANFIRQGFVKNEQR